MRANALGARAVDMQTKVLLGAPRLVSHNKNESEGLSHG